MDYTEDRIKRVFQIILGVCCCAGAYKFFLAPAGLYNGGFTAGITALILIPILEHYLKTPRDFMPHPFDPDASMSVNEEAKRKPR